MKLNKWQRLSAYYIMLAEWDANKERHIDGLCFMIRDLFHEKLSACTVIRDYWEELWAKRPDFVGDNQYASWFPETPAGAKKRRELLLSCIQEFEQQLFTSNQK